MSDYSSKKLGSHVPNLAYDLPEVLIRINTLLRNAELERLPTFIDNAQVLLDAVTTDVESHLLLLNARIQTTRESLQHDNPDAGSLQHSQSAERG